MCLSRLKNYIALFSYDFPHRKTTDFIKQLKANGVENVIVFGAPMKKLSHTDTNEYFPKLSTKSPIIETEKLCSDIGYEFISCEHDDEEKIKEQVENNNISLAIISGARILKKEIIDLFSFGVVNFHPGALPATSGLDAFFYTIKKNVPPGVTVHTINHKVDEGKHINFVECEVTGVDSISEMQESLYQCQLQALSHFIELYRAGNVELKDIHRPEKNNSMSPEQKLDVLSNFGVWRSSQHYRQIKEKILKACESGSVKQYRKVDRFSNFINEGLKNSWTPLVVAAFHQKSDLVQYLIEAGADVNYATPKGTTVLMYAKTALINDDDASRYILELLIKNGARIDAKDIFGKTVIDYTRDLGDENLVKFFTEYSDNAIH